MNINELKDNLKKYQNDLAQLSNKRRCLREHIKSICNDIYKYEKENIVDIKPMKALVIKHL